MAASAKHRISCLLCDSCLFNRDLHLCNRAKLVCQLIGPRPNEPKASNRVGSIGCGSRASQIPSPSAVLAGAQAVIANAARLCGKAWTIFRHYGGFDAWNSGETPWVQKVAGSEFNLLEPGNQLNGG